MKARIGLLFWPEGAGQDILVTRSQHKEWDQRSFARWRRNRSQRLQAFTVEDADCLQVLNDQIPLIGRIEHLRSKVDGPAEHITSHILRRRHALVGYVQENQPQAVTDFRTCAGKKRYGFSIGRKIERVYARIAEQSVQPRFVNGGSCRLIAGLRGN